VAEDDDRAFRLREAVEGAFEGHGGARGFDGLHDALLEGATYRPPELIDIIPIILTQDGGRGVARFTPAPRVRYDERTKTIHVIPTNGSTWATKSEDQEQQTKTF
jgi:hypothetical protein